MSISNHNFMNDYEFNTEFANHLYLLIKDQNPDRGDLQLIQEIKQKIGTLVAEFVLHNADETVFHFTTKEIDDILAQQSIYDHNTIKQLMNTYKDNISNDNEKYRIPPMETISQKPAEIISIIQNANITLDDYNYAIQILQAGNYKAKLQFSEDRCKLVTLSTEKPKLLLLGNRKIELKNIQYNNDNLQINNHTNIILEENITEIIYYLAILTYVPDDIILSQGFELINYDQEQQIINIDQHPYIQSEFALLNAIKNKNFYIPSILKLKQLSVQPNNILYCLNSQGVMIAQEEAQLAKQFLQQQEISLCNCIINQQLQYNFPFNFNVLGDQLYIESQCWENKIEIKLVDLLSNIRLVRLQDNYQVQSKYCIELNQGPADNEHVCLLVNSEEHARKYVYFIGVFLRLYKTRVSKQDYYIELNHDQILSRLESDYRSSNIELDDLEDSAPRNALSESLVQKKENQVISSNLHAKELAESYVQNVSVNYIADDLIEEVVEIPACPQTVIQSIPNLQPKLLLSYDPGLRLARASFYSITKHKILIRHHYNPAYFDQDYKQLLRLKLVAQSQKLDVDEVRIQLSGIIKDRILQLKVTFTMEVKKLCGKKTIQAEIYAKAEQTHVYMDQNNRFHIYFQQILDIIAFGTKEQKMIKKFQNPKDLIYRVYLKTEQVPYAIFGINMIITYYEAYYQNKLPKPQLPPQDQIQDDLNWLQNIKIPKRLTTQKQDLKIREILQHYNTYQKRMIYKAYTYEMDNIKKFNNLFKQPYQMYYKQLFQTREQIFAQQIHQILYDTLNMKNLMMLLISLNNLKIKKEDVNKEYYYNYKCEIFDDIYNQFMKYQNDHPEQKIVYYAIIHYIANNFSNFAEVQYSIDYIKRQLIDVDQLLYLEENVSDKDVTTLIKKLVSKYNQVNDIFIIQILTSNIKSYVLEQYIDEYKIENQINKLDQYPDSLKEMLIMLINIIKIQAQETETLKKFNQMSKDDYEKPQNILDEDYKDMLLTTDEQKAKYISQLKQYDCIMNEIMKSSKNKHFFLIYNIMFYESASQLETPEICPYLRENIQSYIKCYENQQELSYLFQILFNLTDKEAVNQIPQLQENKGHKKAKQ